MSTACVGESYRECKYGKDMTTSSVILWELVPFIPVSIWMICLVICCCVKKRKERRNARNNTSAAGQDNDVFFTSESQTVEFNANRIPWKPPEYTEQNPPSYWESVQPVAPPIRYGYDRPEPEVLLGEGSSQTITISMPTMDIPSPEPNNSPDASNASGSSNTTHTSIARDASNASGSSTTTNIPNAAGSSNTTNASIASTSAFDPTKI